MANSRRETEAPSTEEDTVCRMEHGTRVHDKSTATTVIKSRSSPTEHEHVLYAGPLDGWPVFVVVQWEGYVPATHPHTPTVGDKAFLGLLSNILSM